MTTREIVRNYIYEMCTGKSMTLEDYVKEVFRGQDKVKLRKYCKDQGIYYKKASTREILIQKIYGMCNTGLSYKILRTSDIIGEPIKDYYKRIYIRDYFGEV